MDNDRRIQGPNLWINNRHPYNLWIIFINSRNAQLVINIVREQKKLLLWLVPKKYKFNNY